MAAQIDSANGVLTVDVLYAIRDHVGSYYDRNIFYAKQAGDLENSYVIINSLDSSKTPVEEELGEAYSHTIGVSPGAEFIVVSENRDEDDSEIWVTNLYTNQETRITDNDKAVINPVFSPVDSLLIYSSHGDLRAYNWQDATTTRVTKTSGWEEISACWLE